MKGHPMDHSIDDSPMTIIQISSQPNIGMDSDVRQLVIITLNNALADEMVLAQKTRNACWNVKGAGFLELRKLFNAQTRRLIKLSDDLAERVRALGGYCIGTYQEFIISAKIEETPGMIPLVLPLLADHEAAVRQLRINARKCLDEFEDEGTNRLFINMICEHEKMAWMLRSCLEAVQTRDTLND
jgi:starvation-inducible DNA-binding protein